VNETARVVSKKISEVLLLLVVAWWRGGVVA